MAELAELIKSKRLARKWSLRELGAQIGVTPAYVADLEASRRLPSADLKTKLASVLDIAAEELAAVDLRLTADLKDWIEERPQLTAVLRSLRSSPEADMLIHRLARFMARRSPPKAPVGMLTIWESEIRAIAAEASAWSIETGGDLFGRWNESPIILLASKAGPNAERNNAHFRLDVEYLRHLSEVLATDWALRYFGDWHSHHRLGLSSPSGGDQKRILSIAGRNQFTSMAEIIVTLEDTRDEPTIRIHPWLYDLSTERTDPLPMRLRVLPGVSPIRQALIARKTLPEQELFAWEKISLSRIRIGSETAPLTLEAASDIDPTTREKTLSHLMDALEKTSGETVEQHPTGFGTIIVARLKGSEYLAFALGAAWPMPVLDVHRMNRTSGTTQPLRKPAGLVAADIPGIIKTFHFVKDSQGEATMWSTEQRQRLYLEHQVLQREGFTQFSVYHDQSNDTYYACGYASSSSGRRYRLYITIPSGYPDQRPSMYITDPLPLLMRNGTKLTDLGTSHYMHTLAPSSNGMVQICHWRDARWHSGILLYKVFLKGLLWIEAYEQHLATGRNLSEFVGTMTETA